MILTGGLVYLLFAAISLLSAAAAVVLTGYLQRVVARRHEVSGDGGSAAAFSDRSALLATSRYEFRDGTLVSAIGGDDPFLDPGVDPSRAFAALGEAVGALHPDIADRMSALARRGEPFFLIGYLGPDALSVVGRVMHDRLVVTVMPVEDVGDRRAVDVQSLGAVEREAEELRHALDLSAAMQWKEARDGRVVWANLPYLELAEHVAGGETGRIGWPLPRLFGEQLDPHPPEGSLRRCRVEVPGREDPFWFEVAAMKRPAGIVLYSARRIDRLVAAEATLRDFVQTLSKTFANLPIGLAVFDAKRELVLFNPALVTISTLEPGDLSRRPTLRAFLDQLRERRRMPEPRDYRTWREEIEHLEQRAEEGTYHELWTLPSGVSLRVTGRPHPGGAIAFMFEDISKEISLTRRFRSDLDLYRCVLDDTAAAFAVFDRDGQAVTTNAAYDALWGPDDGDGARAEPLLEVSRRWRAAFAPTGLWGEIRDFAAHATDRAAWAETVTRLGGQRVLCRVAPLKGGHTIVWFLSADAAFDDPTTGWLPVDGPTRSELASGGVATPVVRQGEGAA
ncbi:PAS-domain containing protein [Roseibacterium sp. SDUM158017]|uniref:PAS-domain containing protein n=1 Tax=Roseicyclus salinarum TaxID=3036773 RepID=UPI0024157719|nr:PAS-domain containing protein [Roseibacterium sp. SDUM158017]MDG4650278.1 PAS-domain containing protein [Roseibacterium sp. SDUM158017]